ncbi:excisionase [Enterococcus timonensis]|uniref:excisionase n=1 Tax=Enterococcus timonensis TaxID=1852364 RepID=UPI0008DA9CDB|nr:excisionase [Enterococcus timonensis]
MPKPIQIDLEEVAMDPERAEIKYGSKDVVIKMYSISKASLNKWISQMSEIPEFASGVIHPTHKIVLIELDTFDLFVRWMDKNRYRRKK